MIDDLNLYFSTNLNPIILGFILGCIFVWIIWRFFFHIVYQDDNTDKNIEMLEKKIDQIANHLGANPKNNNKDN